MMNKESKHFTNNLHGDATTQEIRQICNQITLLLLHISSGYIEILNILNGCPNSGVSKKAKQLLELLKLAAAQL